MGLLTATDKEKIKRALPKASNKIIDVTVARLYVAYPNPKEWQYTGLSGGIVLVDDIVGNTFFLKLVDIEGHRGVVWDQELWVGFEYTQDRTFFHSFEMEECYAGLLFDDISEAGHFLKRVQRRDKYASKKTLSNKNAIALANKLKEAESSRVIHGPRGEALISDQRRRYSYNMTGVEEEGIPDTKKKAPPPPPPTEPHSKREPNRSSSLKSAASKYPDIPSMVSSTAPIVDPALGPPKPSRQVTHDTCGSSSDSESTYTSAVTSPVISQRQQKYILPPLPTEFFPLQPPQPPEAHSPSPVVPPEHDMEMSAPVRYEAPFLPKPQEEQSAHPPLPAAPRPPLALTQHPQHEGAVPAPPFKALPQRPVNHQEPSSFVSLPNSRVPSGSGRQLPAPPVVRNNAPPPPPARRGPAPALPPRRVGGPDIHQNVTQQSKHRVANTSAPPPPPRRGPAPPPPPRAPRSAAAPSNPNQNAPTIRFRMNEPPQQASYIPPHQFTPHPSEPPKAALTPTAFRQTPAPTTSQPPPPPPPPPMISQDNIPVAPPPPSIQVNSSQGKLPNPSSTVVGIAETTGNQGRDALLASIRGAGGVHALRKVDKSQLDKPSVLLQEARGKSPATGINASNSLTPTTTGGTGSLADALAAALNQRKNKVAQSQDDYDNGDDW
ncbi:actin-binding protein LAS17 Ecym_3106 [Eremothecium cymbalariae DBVPG|uniref:WH1 domain-containing protein n=1 Tax=Eremothecium cymbalariae (strain CBS 270.75 / DBVPG 7215 / KCTC 17166 / NRRL Y-17582) TaxID=931890 RepID=G8JR45_ERECY|nr:Hypothetical protein Ecym_3106 [Eremothecium cymbalariae DBVPG\